MKVSLMKISLIFFLKTGLIDLEGKALAGQAQIFAEKQKAPVLALLPYSRTALQPPKATATVFDFVIDF
ncbi:hypothetical protein AEQU3_02232 [Aequorivita antarctica]|nr:hypothetical protein AEQU3_02232 [Aequorivita antarctica]